MSNRLSQEPLFDTAVTRTYGLRLPIIAGGLMWLSDANYVAAAAHAGIVSFITAASFPDPDDLRKELRKCRALCNGQPFGVNVSMLPKLVPGDKTESLFRLIADEGVRFVETSGRNPEPYMPILKDAGIIVLHKVPNVRYAVKAQSVGVDMVSIVGAECGGHPGMDMIGSIVNGALAERRLTIPFLIGGGIGCGSQIVAALAMGAAGVVMGTRFLVAEEISAHPNYKLALSEASERDTALTMHSVRNTIRTLRNETTESVARLEAENPSIGIEELMPYVSGKVGREAYRTGDTSHGMLSAGQALGLTERIEPLAAIVNSLESEARTALARLTPLSPVTDTCSKDDTVASRIHHNIDQCLIAGSDNPAAIDFDGRRFSYADLDHAVSDAEEVLLQSDVQPGDRVLVVAENCIAAVAFVYAASRIDAWAVPVNARMTEPELTRIVNHAKPRATVYTCAASPDACSHAERENRVAIESRFGKVAIATPFDSFPHPVEAGPEQVAVLLYTTGTTGDPKGVMLTHGNLLFAGAASAKLRGMTPKDVVYGVLPMTHVFGLASMVVAASQAGACIMLQNRFRADALYRALNEEVTILPAVPQMHAHLMHYTREQGYSRLESDRLRYVSSGAAPLDPDWKRRAEAFYGIPLQNGYGMTETTAGVCATSNDFGDPDISVGYPLPGVEVRLDTAIGNSDDTVGEILTRGAHVMKGYYRNAEETRKVLDADGFLRTGDLGRFDEEGRLHIVGRSKELIIRSGFNVYPQEVENALNDHPAVIQAAVIGRTLAGGNEEVLAFVQTADPSRIDEDTLKQHAATRLASYKRPARIIITDQLPAAATGKILKHRLIEMFREAL